MLATVLTAIEPTGPTPAAMWGQGWEEGKGDGLYTADAGWDQNCMMDDSMSLTLLIMEQSL